MEGEDEEATRGRWAQSALCCLALQLAALAPRERAAAIGPLQHAMYAVVAEQCAVCSGAALPLALLQALLPLMLRDGHQAATLVQPLLDMLQSADAASATAVQLTAELALAYPAELLPDVLAKLDSPLPTQRANALAILSALAQRSALQPLAGRQATRDVALALLPRLGDESLFLRMRAARLFEQLEPAFILPRLVPHLLAQSAPLRAAAEEAALAALRGAGESTAAAVLVDALRDAPHAADAGAPVASPGDIGQLRPTAGAGVAVDAQELKRAERTEERLLRVVRRWAGELRPEQWPGALHCVCTKFFSAAQDASSMKALKRLIAVEGAAVHVHVVLEAALVRLRALPPAKPNGAEIETFDRLRPLLLLSLLPEDGWIAARATMRASTGGELDALGEKEGDAAVACCAAAFVNSEEEVRSRLLLALRADAELQPVRKMAASLLGRLHTPPLLPPMLAEVRQLAAAPLGHCSTLPGDGAVRASLALFYLCCAATLHPAAADAVAAAETAEMLVSLWGVPRPPEALRRLQLGTMDCLARALATQLLRLQAAQAASSLAAGGSGRRPLIAEVPSVAPGAEASWNASLSGDQAAAPPLLARLLSECQRGSATLPCALNTLIIASQQLHARGGAAAASLLAAGALPALLPVEGAEVTQALFNVAFHAQSHLPRPCLQGMLTRALSEARSRDEAVRLAALKLVGIVLSAATSVEAWGPDPDGQLREVMALLESVRNMDESREVRHLAHSLSTTAFGSEQ